MLSYFPCSLWKIISPLEMRRREGRFMIYSCGGIARCLLQESWHLPLSRDFGFVRYTRSFDSSCCTQARFCLLSVAAFLTMWNKECFSKVKVCFITSEAMCNFPVKDLWSKPSHCSATPGAHHDKLFCLVSDTQELSLVLYSSGSSSSILQSESLSPQQSRGISREYGASTVPDSSKCAKCPF